MVSTCIKLFKIICFPGILEDFFNTVMKRGHVGPCKVIHNENHCNRPDVIIQMNRYDVNYYYRKPSKLINSWSIIIEKLQAKSIHFITSSLIRVKFAIPHML